MSISAGDIASLVSAVNSVRDLERQLPYSVKCGHDGCGETVTTQRGEPVYCVCGVHHTFLSERTPS